jgi:hypothetical protein
MKFLKRSLFWAVLAFATSWLAFVCVTKKREPINVSVTYIGAENYKHWGPCAFFGVTNTTSFPVNRGPGIDVEGQKTGAWTSIMYQQPQVLGPGKGEILVFQRPTNQEPWRLVLTFSRAGLRSRFAAFAGKYRWSEYIPWGLSGVPCEFQQSDWVKGE